MVEYFTIKKKGEGGTQWKHLGAHDTLSSTVERKGTGLGVKRLQSQPATNQPYALEQVPWFLRASFK